jgi:putative transposase
MTKPYSMDLRERVVSAVDAEGMSRHEAAARFGIAVSSAVRGMARYRKTGSVAPSKIGGYKPKTFGASMLRDWRQDVRKRTSPSASSLRSFKACAG